MRGEPFSSVGAMNGKKNMTLFSLTPVLVLQTPEVFARYCFRISWLSSSQPTIRVSKDALAVVKAAQAARRNLDVPRPPLMVLPIVGRFDARDNVAEADQWLKRFSVELKPFYDDWLPRRFKPLQILELTKIPYVTQFSFGEKLPVLTHGISDPLIAGLLLPQLGTTARIRFSRCHFDY